MDTALIAFLVSAGTGTAIALVNWLLSRSGRQLLTRKDLREEVAQLWKRVDELNKDVSFWQERYEKLEADFDERERRRKIEAEEIARQHAAEMVELQRKYQALLIEVQSLRAAQNSVGG